MSDEAGPILTKRCCDCGDAKQPEDFHVERRRADGRQQRCKPCQIARMSARQNGDRRIRQMLISAKGRAKQQGVPFGLTEDDVVIPTFCPALGLKLEWSYAGENKDHSPSLDKIIPELGYVPGNIVVVSNLANRLKSNGTFEQLRNVADFYTRIERTLWIDKINTMRSGRSASATSME